MIKSFRQYRAVPSFDEVMKSEQAKPIPSFDEIMGSDKKKVETIGNTSKTSVQENTTSKLNLNRSISVDEAQSLLGNTSQEQRDNQFKIQVTSKPSKQAIVSRKLTDDEVEKEAQNRLSDKSNAILLNGNDPIGNFQSAIQNSKQNIPLISSDEQGITQNANEGRIHNKMSELLQKNAFSSTKEASDYLYNQVKKVTGKETAIKNIAIPDLQKILPQNLSTELAIKKVAANQYIGSIMDESKDFNEFIQKYPSLSQKFSDLNLSDENGQSRAYQMILNDPDVIEAAKDRPKMWNQYLSEKNNFNNRFPDLAYKDVAHKVAQYAQDEGKNGIIYTNRSKKGWDDIVEEMYKKGKIDATDRALYYQKINKRDLPTGDVLDMAWEGYKKATNDIGTTFKLDKLGLAVPSENFTEITPSGNKVLGGGAGFTAYIAPMLVGGAELKALGATPKVANLLMGMVQFGGSAQRQAKKYFPDNPANQFGYTLLNVAFNTIALDVPIEGAQKSINTFLGKEAQNIIPKLTSNTISESGKEQIKQSFLKKTATVFGKYGIDVLKNTTTTAGSLTTLGILNRALNLTAGDKHAFDNMDLPQEFADYFKTALPLGVLGATANALAKKSPKINKPSEETKPSDVTNEDVIAAIKNHPDVPNTVSSLLDSHPDEIVADLKEQVKQGMKGGAKNVTDAINGVYGKEAVDLAKKQIENERQSEPNPIPTTDNKGAEVGSSENGSTPTIENKDGLVTPISGDRKDVGSEEYKLAVEPPKPITEMNSEEMYQYADNVKRELRKQDKEFDGKSEDEKLKGGYYNTIDNYSDLRDVAQRINYVESAENLSDLTSSARSALSNMKGKPSEYDLAVLNAIKKRGSELNIEPETLIKEVVKAVGNRFKDKEDAEFMMRKALETIIPKEEPQPQKQLTPISRSGEDVGDKTVETIKSDKPRSVDMNQNFQDRIAAINSIHDDLQKKAKNGKVSVEELGKLEEMRDAEIDKLQNDINSFKKQAKENGVSIYDNNKILSKVNGDIEQTNSELGAAKEKLHSYKPNSNIVAGGQRIMDVNRRGQEAIIKQVIQKLDRLKRIKSVIEKNIESKDIVGDVDSQFKSSGNTNLREAIDYVHNGSGENFIKGDNPKDLSTEFLNTKPTNEIPITTESQSNTTTEANKNIQPTEEGKAEPIEPITESKQNNGEPPTGTGEAVGGEGGDISGITHAANEVRRQDRALPEYEKTPETFEQWNNEAEKKIKDGYDVEKLMDKIEKGHNPSPVENAIRKIYIATLDAEIARNPTDELLAKQKRFIEIGDLANSRAGKNLVSLKGEGSPLSSISDFYVSMMEAKNVDKLTDAEKEAVRKDYEEVKVAREKAEKAEKEATAKFEEMKAENELLKQQLAAKNKTKSDKVYTKDGKRDFKAEINNYKDDLKKAKEEHDKWLKDNGIQQAGVSGVVLTPKMAKIILKIAATHVEQVGVKIAEVTRRTWEDVKDIFDGISEKDIMDVFSGKYDEKKQTRNEIIAQMRELKTEAALLDEYDRLLKGGEPKEESRKQKRNERLSEIRKKIDALKKDHGLGKYSDEAKNDVAQKAAQKSIDDLQEKIDKNDLEITAAEKLKETEKTKGLREKRKELQKQLDEKRKEAKEGKYSDEAVVKRAIDYNKRKSAEFERKLKEGDFEKAPKPTSIYDAPEFKKKNPKLYNNLLDSKNAADESQLKFEKKLVEEEMKKWGLGDKIRNIMKKFSGTLKTLFASFDASAIGVQNLPMILTNPIMGGKGIVRSYKGFFKQKAFDRVLTEIHNAPDWPMVKECIRMSEPKSLLESGREEYFPDRFKAVVTIKGKQYGWIKIKGHKYELVDISKPFERQFTMLGNLLRITKFRTEAAKLYEKGYTWEKNPEEFKTLGKRINNLTSSSDIPQAYQNDITRTLIWSTKLIAAKLNMLGISDIAAMIPGTGVKKGYYKGLGIEGKIISRQQALAAADLAKFAVGVVTATYLYALARGGTVNTDPYDNGFLDVQYGDGKSMNFTGGFGRYISLVFQMAAGGKSKNGVFKKYAGNTDRVKEAAFFVSGKAPPMTRTVFNLAAGKDFVGQPTDIPTEAAKYKMPLSVGQIYKQVERDGAQALFTEGILNFIGINSKDNRDFAKDQYADFSTEEKKDPTFKTFMDKGVNLPELDPKKISTKEVNGKATEHLSDYPKEIQDKFISAKKKYLKEELQSLMDGTYEIYRDEDGTAHIAGENTDTSDMKEISFNDLSKDDIQYLIGQYLSGNATKKAKSDEILKK